MCTVAYTYYNIKPKHYRCMDVFSTWCLDLFNKLRETEVKFSTTHADVILSLRCGASVCMSRSCLGEFVLAFCTMHWDVGFEIFNQLTVIKSTKQLDIQQPAGRIHQLMQFVKRLYTQWCNMRFRGLTMLATKNMIHSVSDRRNSSAYH